MDAVEFLEEQYRMCEALNSHCEECGLSYTNNKTDRVCGDFIKRHPEEAVAIVEKWAKEHPRKTRQEKFLEMFPKTHVDANNVITICPYETCIGYKCDLKWGESTESKCRECRKKYWLEEIE